MGGSIASEPSAGDGRLSLLLQRAESRNAEVGLGLAAAAATVLRKPALWGSGRATRVRQDAEGDDMRTDQRLGFHALLVSGLVAGALLATVTCGRDPSTPATSPSPAAAARPVPPPVPDAWAAWVEANHFPVRSVSATDTDFTDLQFLRTVIGARSLVQIGESSHGVGEFDSVKVRLIRFLHEEMGFDVIAFESGLYECFRADEQASRLDAATTMRNSIFGVWHAEETLPLFEYLRTTKATGRPLTLAGFDTQFSPSARSDRAADLAPLIAAIDPLLAEEARALDLELVRLASIPLDTARTEIAPKVEQMTASYQRIAEWIDHQLPRLERAFPDRPLYPQVMAQAMRMAPYEVRCLATGAAGTDYGNIRDQGMAENVSFLIRRLYPGSKIVTWAHNYHVQHDATELSAANRNMGSYLVQRHRAELYTVGLFMYWGRAANNDRTQYSITAPTPNSLEALMGRATPPASFVDLLGQTPSDGTAWMFQPITSKSSGQWDQSQSHRRQYDGILFVDEVHPPRYR